MAKNKISFSFRLVSLLSVISATVLSSVFQTLYLWAASDVTVNNVFAYIFRGSYELLNLFAIAMAISATVYAHAYFGKNTAVRTLLLSLLSLLLGKVILFIYNLIVNSLTTAQLISGALTYFVDILFYALVLIIAIIFSYIFAKRRVSCKSPRAESIYSPTKTAAFSAGAYIFILLADLSLTRVIPFFLQYDDPTASEIKAIISDYLYYAFTLPVTILLVLLAFFILTKATGKLRLKKYYEPKTSKE